MPATPRRMEQLQAMLQRQPNDTFLLYALAQEHKKANELSQAMEYLDRVLQLDGNYSYAYFQRGSIHEMQGNLPAAKDAYQQGLAAAQRAGDAHAASELQTALGALQ